MNERIKKFAEQARLYASEQYPGSFVKYDPKWFEIYDAKFAELIIRECLDQIHVADVGDLKAKSYYLDKVAEHIEKHFGVEE